MNNPPLACPSQSCWTRLRKMAQRSVWPCLAASLLLTGCKSIMPDHDAVVGPIYKPTNIYRAATTLPQTVRRVAVLPLASSGTDATAEEGRLALHDVLNSELNKTQAFEVIPVSGEQMTSLAGKAWWSAEDALPQGVIKKIKDALACDAVLFAKLTQFRPYQPIAIGWNIKLVECKENRILWSVDETFDSGDGPVSNAARQYYHQHLGQPEPLSDSRSILSSPRRFGQYTLSAVLATLPGR